MSDKHGVVVSFLLAFLLLMASGSAIPANAVTAGVQIDNSFNVTYEWNISTGTAARDINSNTVTQTVGETGGMAVAPLSETAFVRPGETYAYAKRIYNRGNFSDTFSLRPDSQFNWFQSFFQDMNSDSKISGADSQIGFNQSILIPQNGDSGVVVRVFVPVGETHGLSDTLFFVVQSGLDATVFETGTLNLTIDGLVDTVTLTSPLDGHATTTAAFIAAWYAVSDSAGVDSYVVEISNTSGFASVKFADTIDASLTFDTLTGLYNDSYYWRVRAVDALGNISPDTSARGFMHDTDVDTVRLRSPTDQVTTTVTTPVLEWLALADSVGVDSYFLEVSNTWTFAPLAFSDTLNGNLTSDTINPPLGADSYYWRVRAIDLLGNIGVFGDSRIFIIDSALSIALASPPANHATTNAVITFVWTGNAETYAWQFSKDSTFATLSDSVADTTSKNVRRAIADEDTWYWRVLGQNAQALDSGMRSIFLDSSARKVTLAAPDSGASTTDTTPAFTWTAVTDSSGIDSYAIELSRADTFGPIVWADTVDGALTTATSDSLTDDTYYWRVRAIDHLGNVGAYSDSRFLRVDTDLTVTLTAPAANHATFNAAITFSWSGDADTWTWQLSRDSGFTTVDTAAVDTTALNVTVTLAIEDTWYWRVIGQSANGQMDTAPARALLLDRHVDTVTLIAPPTGTYTNDTTPLLRWVSLADSVGIDSYLVYVSKFDTFTPLLFQDTKQGYETSVTTSGLPGLIAGETIFWRVRAIDTLGNVSPVADSWLIFIDTGTSVSADTPLDGHQTRSATVTFKWTSDADTYTWQLSNVNTFATISDSVVDTTTSTVTRTLPFEDTWFWRVMATDAAGNYDTSLTRGLLLDSTVNKVVLDTPVSGARSRDTTPTFNWITPVDSVGIETYAVELSRSDTFSTVVWSETLTATRTFATSDSLVDDTYYWRVRAIDRLGNAGLFVDSNRIVIDTDLNVTLTNPAAGAQTRSTVIVFVWASDGDTFTWQLAKDTAFTAISDSVVDTTGLSVTRTVTGEDTWYWRVIGADGAGNFETTSARGFVLDTHADRPSLADPADNHETKNASLILRWTAIADSVGIDSYAVEVSSSGTFAVIAFADTVDVSLTTDTLQGLGEDTWFWRVRAIDVLGNVGLVSDTRLFILDSGVTVLAENPSNPEDTFSTNILFRWTTNDAETFTWQIDTDSTFGSVDTVVTDTTVRSFITPIQREDTYYWRVIGKDRGGNVDTTPAQRLLIDFTPPTVITPLAPSNGHMTSFEMPTFTWTASSDTMSGLLYYVIDIFKDTPVSVASIHVSGTVTTTSFTHTEILPADTYFWRVTAWDVAGNTTASAVFELAIVEPRGSMTFDKVEYQGFDDVATITLVDVLANLSAVAKDYADVNVFSDADLTGFTLPFEETELNSGVFTNTIKFTNGVTDVSTRKIQVNLGGSVTARRVQANGFVAEASTRWIPSAALIAPTSVDGVRSWPNPAKFPDPIIFQALPADMGMTIGIYTLDMQLVRTLSPGAGINVSSFGSVARWDGRNDGGQYVSSGTYLYIVRSPKYGTKVSRITFIK